MSSALTKRIVLTAEPKERPYELRDTRVRGLILRVQPFGHKAWIVTCKARGQDKITPNKSRAFQDRHDGSEDPALRS